MSDRTAAIQDKIAEKFDPGAVQDMTASSGGVVALIPDSFGQLMEFSKLMATTNAVPPHLRGKPGDCLAVAMQAMRWGMDPFAVASKSYFVNDRMAYESQLVNAVLYARAPLDGRLQIEFEGEGEALVCRVTGKLLDDPNPHTVVQEIKTITTRNSPLWKQAPRQQMGYFTTRMWARLYAPDALLGIYTPEELERQHLGPDHAKDVTPRPQRGDYGAAGAQPVTGEIIDDEPEREPYTLVNEFGEVIEEITGPGPYAEAMNFHIGRIKTPGELQTFAENNETMTARLAEESPGNAEAISGTLEQRFEELAEARKQDAQPESQETQEIDEDALAKANEAEAQAEAASRDFRVPLLIKDDSNDPDWVAYYQAVKRVVKDAKPADMAAIREANDDNFERMRKRSAQNYKSLMAVIDDREAEPS